MTDISSKLKIKARLTILNTWFMWGAFGLSAAAISQTSWIYYSTFQEGLFTRETTGVRGSGVSIARTSWLDGSAAMMIIGIVFLFSAAFSLQILATMWGPTKAGRNLNAWKAATVFATIGAWFMVIGCAIYTGSVEQGYAGSGNTYDASATRYGAGFGMGWGAAGLANIAATILWLVVRDLEQEDLDTLAQKADEDQQRMRESGKCCA